MIFYYRFKIIFLNNLIWNFVTITQDVILSRPYTCKGDRFLIINIINELNTLFLTKHISISTNNILRNICSIFYDMRPSVTMNLQLILSAFRSLRDSNSQFHTEENCIYDKTNFQKCSSCVLYLLYKWKDLVLYNLISW